MRKLFAALGILASFGSTAAEAQTKNWTGFYVGLHGGYSWFDQEFPGAPTHVPSPVPPGVKSGPPRMDLDGAMLGGTVGAQYHFQGGIVVGVEADYSVGNLGQTVRDGNFITQTGEIDWTGTLRARVGLPMGPAGAWMPYITAGYMWAGASYNQKCPDGASAGHCSTAKQYSVTREETHTGFVYGGGLEVMVSNNFSVKAEGLWFNLSDETYAMGSAPLSGVPIGNKVIEYDGAMLRIGGNYRF